MKIVITDLAQIRRQAPKLVLYVTVGFGVFAVGIYQVTSIGWIPALGIAAAIYLVILAAILAGAWRHRSTHPADQIIRLMNEGRPDDACALGEKLLLDLPEDFIVRVNCTAALHRAGKLAEARRVFSGINENSVPGGLSQVYQDWKKTLGLPTET